MTPTIFWLNISVLQRIRLLNPNFNIYCTSVLKYVCQVSFIIWKIYLFLQYVLAIFTNATTKCWIVNAPSFPGIYCNNYHPLAAHAATHSSRLSDTVCTHDIGDKLQFLDRESKLQSKSTRNTAWYDGFQFLFSYSVWFLYDVNVEL